MGKARAAPKASRARSNDSGVFERPIRGNLGAMDDEATGSPRPAGPAESKDVVSAPGFSLDPQRLLRIAGVTREVLDEARRIRPEPGAVDHLPRGHAQIREGLKDLLPDPLYH